MDSRIYMVVLTIMLIAIPGSSEFQSDLSAIPSHTVAQDGSTTWHHDCSNTTGFTRVDDWNTDIDITYGELKSNGNSLWFDNITDVEGIHGPIFVYEFNESFQLAAFEEFSAQVHLYNQPYDRGQLNIYLADEMRVPILQTYILDEWNDPSAYWDVYFYYGSTYHSLVNGPERPYGITYNDGLRSYDFTYTFTYPDSKIIPTGAASGNGAVDFSNVGALDDSRNIKYLVIEYGEYDVGNYDLSCSIQDLTVKYNTNTVETPENFDLYYLVPDSYRWNGQELFIDSDLTDLYLSQYIGGIHYAFITSGTWRISILHDSSLELRIETTVDGTKTTSGTGSGDFPSIDFVATEKTYVLIDVIENSASGDSSGHYNISLDYVSSSTSPITGTTSTTTTSSSTTTTNTDPTANTNTGIEPLSPALSGIAIFGFSAIMIVSAIFLRNKRLSKHKELPEMVFPKELDTVEVQIQDIPIDYQPVAETREIIRTIRLPVKCPNCDGAVIQEEIDWTGPLQAKCNYCGSVLRATFECV